MVKRYKTLLSLLLVVLTVFAVITVTGVVDINKMVREHEEETTAGEAPKASLDETFSTYSDAGLPLLKTDIDNVFYTMSKSGDVNFFKASEGKIKQLDGKETFDVTVTCSGQQLPATIHYIEIDGQTAGYGLFTNENHPDVYLYDYAFFKVTDQFEAYDSKSDLLLLADIEKARFYDENKVYSESFYLYESKETDNFLNEDQRIVDLSARLRSDYKMFTDSILHQTDDKILFFSSRFYNDYGHSEKVDIFVSGGSGENVDNNRYILDIASLNFWETEDGIFYFALKETEETEAVTEETTTATGTSADTTTDTETVTSAFALMKYKNGESEEVISFDGSLNEDFIISGTKLFNKKSGDIYDIISGKLVKFDYEEFKTSFTPDLFKASDNGRYCIIRGRSNLGKPSLGIIDTKTGEIYTYTDNAFGHIASIQALDDGTVILSLAASEAAESFYQLVATIGENEAPSEEETSSENETFTKDEASSEVETLTEEIFTGTVG